MRIGRVVVAAVAAGVLLRELWRRSQTARFVGAEAAVVTAAAIGEALEPGEAPAGNGRAAAQAPPTT